MIQHLLKLITVGGIVSGCSFFSLGEAQQPNANDIRTCPGGKVIERTDDGQFPPCPYLGDTVSHRRFFSSDIPKVHDSFTFSGVIPHNWEVESVSEIDSLNIYDPGTDGDTTLEQSQIFIRYFTGYDFLTLDTVTIHSRDDTTFLGQPAVIYDIEKKESVPDFLNQPSWRNQRHTVIDIRESDDSPSVFYVFAFRPDIDVDVINHFLFSLYFDTDDVVRIEFPVEDFFKRITKKPFGIYVSPENSPTMPERFIGYHTGVDVEYDDQVDEVPVRAIADGEVVLSRVVDGYGGVVVLTHIIEGDIFYSLYGHLRPNSLKSFSVSVRAGETIGVLGEGATEETDGERKHLHFALYSGDTIHLEGYVENEKALEGWIDPAGFFATL